MYVTPHRRRYNELISPRFTETLSHVNSNTSSGLDDDREVQMGGTEGFAGAKACKLVRAERER